MFAAKFKHLDVDSFLKIKWNNQLIEANIIGISRDLFIPPTIYFDNEYFTSKYNLRNVTNLVMIDIDNDKIGSFPEYSTKLENKLSEDEINVKVFYRKDTYKKAVVEHLVIIMTMLIMMTFLLLIVGGLGLATTMSINVVERKRELGILRAIGVTDKKMYRLLLFEGITFGLISWVFAALIAMPLSYFLGNKFFTIFFETTLSFSVSPSGIIYWLLISIVFSFFAVLFPARNISKMNACELIAYE
jgi:putative ABC transport system permease protein